MTRSSGGGRPTWGGARRRRWGAGGIRRRGRGSCGGWWGWVGERARQGGEAAADARQAASRRLLGVTRASLRQAAAVRERLVATGGAAAERLLRQLDRFAPLVERVVDQARRRILAGE